MAARTPHVVPPQDNPYGHTYGELVEYWMNWFFSDRPDDYNTRSEIDVKFLRSYPSPEKLARLLPVGQPYEGSPMFRNLPNTMVGTDGLTIYEDQAIFFPVMLAVYIKDDDTSYSRMEQWVTESNTENSDPPRPQDFTIDRNPLVRESEISMYKVQTRLPFRLDIPDTPYGRSLGPFIQSPPAPGQYDAYAEGYFFLVTGFKARRTPYRLFSLAEGARYQAGPYFASFCYDIYVRTARSIRKPDPNPIPPKVYYSIDKELKDMKQDGRLDEPDYKEWNQIIYATKNKQQSVF